MLYLGSDDAGSRCSSMHDDVMQARGGHYTAMRIHDPLDTYTSTVCILYQMVISLCLLTHASYFSVLATQS